MIQFYTHLFEDLKDLSPMLIPAFWSTRSHFQLTPTLTLSHTLFRKLHVLLGLQAPIINFNEYKTWREHGIAFELREDSTYEVPNRTLASGIIFNKVILLCCCYSNIAILQGWKK